MNIFNRDPAKSVTISIKNTIRRTVEGLVLLGGLVGCLVLLAGCPDSGGGKEKPKPTSTTPTPGGGGNAGGSSEPKITVGDPPFSVTFNENGPETLVDLPYKGQGGAVPTSCEVSSPLMVTVTTPCACSEGVCRVGVQPTPKVFGDGSFEFRLSDQSGQKEISSNTGKASVKVLEVTLSISSGDKQDGIVGTNLPAPIVVLVQNSNKVPVSGVKVFWNIEKGGEDWKEEVTGKTSSCTETTDDRGLAQCTWTLGTIIFTASKKVNVSAFYNSEEIYKKTLGGSFSASAKPDEIAVLSFWSFPSTLPRGSKRLFNLYRGSPYFGKMEKVGAPLGKESDGGGLWIFAQDKHGNPTTVKEEGIDVTLSLGGTKPEGAVFYETTITNRMVNININQNDDYPDRMQGVAKFKDVKVNKTGTYALDASGPADLGLKSETYFDTFNVYPGAAIKLVFTTPPRGGVAGVAWSPQPVVAIWDAFDNTVDYIGSEDPVPNNAEIKLAIGTNGATIGSGVLSGSTGATSDLSRNADEGVATFSGLKIDKAGNGYTLTASSGALSVTSSPFDIQ